MVANDRKAKFFAKVNGFFDFLGNKFENVVREFGEIREKAKDLSTTNYKLGLKHLEKGNLSEAVFRFKMVKKFWPENYEAYYQLAYALVLSKKMIEARKVIDELLAKDRSYEPKVLALLNSVDVDCDQPNNNQQ